MTIKELFDSDPRYGQFLRFCINGVLAVCIQYAVYLVCIRWMNEFVANTIGYCISFCCNFVITSYWTFKSKPSWKRLTGFGGSHVINYLVQQMFLALFLYIGIGKEWAALFAMGSAVPVNFCLLHFVYRK